MKEHRRKPFDDKVIGFWERRKGQVIDQETIDAFAPRLWRWRTIFELEIMRSMREK